MNKRGTKIGSKQPRWTADEVLQLAIMVAIPNLSLRKINKHGADLYRLQYYRNDDIKLLVRWIYEDAELFLLRKREICDRIIPTMIRGMVA